MAQKTNGKMSYFAAEWTLLPTDLRAATAPGLPQDLRVMSWIFQSCREFVWIVGAHIRSGPNLWSWRARLCFLQWANSIWVDRSAGLHRFTVWVQRRKGWLAANYAKFCNSELINMLIKIDQYGNFSCTIHINENILSVTLLCIYTSLLLNAKHFI